MSELQYQLKIKAAETAIDSVEPGMVIGIGEGSTALCAIEVLASRIKSGALGSIVCITASERMSNKAKELGLTLTNFDQHPAPDLTIDGADEVDPSLNLIKGGGGALLREKILAQASQQLLIIADESKLTEKLGTKWALPVEVIPYGWETQAWFLESLEAKATLRQSESGGVFQTDHGNFILDADFGPIDDIGFLADQLDARAGIVEHGLFIGLADEVIVSDEAGVRRLQP